MGEKNTYTHEDLGEIFEVIKRIRVWISKKNKLETIKRRHWTIGITSEPDKRKKEHNVQDDNWLLIDCKQEKIADEAERFFVYTYNYDGGYGGRNNNNPLLKKRYIYCFNNTLVE